MALNYDNIASNIYVAHEITWQVPGYSGRWDTWVKTFIMHKMSDGSYNYDVNGNLPPNPEGGSYVP